MKGEKKNVFCFNGVIASWLHALFRVVDTLIITIILKEEEDKLQLSYRNANLI